MPRKPSWLQCIGEAIHALEHLPAPVVDRAGLEHLFGVSRREAIRLMHRFGGYQSGRAFLVSREDLLKKLRAVKQTDNYRWEIRRRERIAQSLTAVRREAAARSVIIRAPASEPSALAELPGVQLSRGYLQISFASAEELLERLYGLSQAIANDMDAFREAVR